VLSSSPQSAVIYELTDRGRTLHPAVDALEAWREANVDR
jgi:DNA-binding HxlR family transcriptional regulator